MYGIAKGDGSVEENSCPLRFICITSRSEVQNESMGTGIEPFHPCYGNSSMDWRNFDDSLGDITDLYKLTGCNDHPSSDQNSSGPPVKIPGGSATAEQLASTCGRV